MSERLPAAARRERILRAFVRETLTRGSVSAVGMRAVAQRAGCTAPVIYRFFGDRRGLVRAAVRWTYAPLVDELEELGRSRKGSAGQRIRALTQRFLGSEAGEDEAFEALVYTECRGDRAIRTHVSRVFGRVEALLVALLREGIESSEFDAALDPRYAAWRLIDLALFVNQSRVMRLETPDQIDYGRRAVDSLLREIAR